MKAIYIALITTLTVAPAAAHAQQAAQPAPATPAPAAAAPVAPAPTAAPSAPAAQPAQPAVKYAPGWVIEVFPSGGERNPGKQGQDGFGAFISTTSNIKMDAHQKTVKVNANYMYEGKAFFKATKDGRYSFVGDVEEAQDNPGACFLDINIEGQPIFQQDARGAVQNPKGPPFTLTGGVDLTKGLYEISFQAGCYYLNNPKRAITLSIKVREPGAPLAQEMTGKDIVHVSN